MKYRTTCWIKTVLATLPNEVSITRRTERRLGDLPGAVGGGHDTHTCQKLMCARGNSCDLHILQGCLDVHPRMNSFEIPLGFHITSGLESGQKTH